MINLHKPVEARSKNKTMYPANKSHIASMNLRTSDNPRSPFKNIVNIPIEDEPKLRSNNKPKKSLFLQDITVNFEKKNGSYIQFKEEEALTERGSKEKGVKHSIDLKKQRMKT